MRLHNKTILVDKNKSDLKARVTYICINQLNLSNCAIFITLSIDKGLFKRGAHLVAIAILYIIQRRHPINYDQYGDI